MRSSIKRSLTGLLIASALAFGAVGANAAGGGNANGADAFIGIVGGNPGTSLPSIPYNYGTVFPGYENGGAHRNGHHSYGGNGGYDGDYYRGY